MKLLKILWGDMHYQLKYGFYLAYAIVAIFYVVMLAFVPVQFSKQVVAFIIFSDPAALGFFFVGGIFLLERDEDLHSYFTILPVVNWYYILAKVMSLALISLIVALLISFVGTASTVNYGLLCLTVVLGATLFTALGIAVATWSKSINHYFVLSLCVAILLMVPLLLSYLDILSGFMQWCPVPIFLILLQMAVGLPSVISTGLALLVLTFWTALAYLVAYHYFSRYLTRLGD